MTFSFDGRWKINNRKTTQQMTTRNSISILSCLCVCSNFICYNTFLRKIYENITLYFDHKIITIIIIIWHFSFTPYCLGWIRAAYQRSVTHTRTTHTSLLYSLDTRATHTYSRARTFFFPLLVVCLLIYLFVLFGSMSICRWFSTLAIVRDRSAK